MEYSRIFGSQFPEALTIQEKLDVDDTILSVVNKIENYLKAGNMAAASKTLEENRDTLEPYLIDSNFINLLQEETYNIGLFALSKQQNIVSTTMPNIDATTYSYWIQDFE